MMKKAIQRFIRDDKGNAKVVLIDAQTLQPVLNPAEYDIINQTELPYWEPVQDVAQPDVPSKVQPPAEILNHYIQQSGGDPTHPAVKSAVQTISATQSPATPTAGHVGVKAGVGATAAPEAATSSGTSGVGPAAVTPADVSKAEVTQTNLPDTINSPAPSATAAPAPAGIGTTRSRSPNPTASTPDPAAPAPSSVKGKVDVNGDVNPLGIGSAPGYSFYNPGQEGISEELGGALTKASADTGKPLGITSGYRSPEHNAAVGGTKGSYHMKGQAADIDMSGMSDKERRALVDSLSAANAGGLITYDASPDMLHVDMRPKSLNTPHYMHNKTAKQLEKAPGWFQDAAAKDYFGTERKDMANPGPAPRPDVAPQTSPAKGIINAAKDIVGDPSKVSPAQMASFGLNRTPDQISRMAAAFAGELSPSQLDALAAGDETAKKELAGMITTAENRAAVAKSFDAVFDPSQYNSMMESKQSVTRANYEKYGQVLRDTIPGYYAGTLTPESYEDTSYYNAEISNPDWGIANTGPYGLKDAKQIGDHTFGSVKDRSGYRTTDLSGRSTGPTEGGTGRFGAGGLGRGLDSPSESGGRFGGSGLGKSYSGKSGSQDSPSEGGSRFGGSGLGSSKSSGKTGYGHEGKSGQSKGPSGGGKSWGGPR